MANGVLMPKQGITVESCILTKWFVKEGDNVKKGDIIFSYETDKSAFEQESEFEGTVLKLFCAEGDEVPVLSNVCAIGTSGEDYSSLSPSNIISPETKEIKTDEKEEINENFTIANETITTNENSFNSNFIKASPRAKNLAQKNGVDLSKIIPSGPNNRIIEKDVINSDISKNSQKTFTTQIENNTENNNEFNEEKLSNVRKVIAKSMMNSLASMAQLTMNISFDLTNINEFRNYLKANNEKLNLPSITYNHIIIFAVSRILKDYRFLNAHLVNNDTLHVFKHVNIGIATDTPRGLLVPTLFGADKLKLSEIASKAKELSNAAIKGNINLDLLKNASFTISNVGAIGIESFTPVINPPQTGILGVNAITTKVKLSQSGTLIPYSSMGLSLTFDHRALDGAPAGRFLSDLKNYLENFSLNIIKENNLF